MTATPTIHLAVVRALRLIFRDVDIIPGSIARDDPASRRTALYVINGAWGMFAFAFCIAIGLVGFPVRAIAGDGAGNVVVSIAAGACFFCLAGCAHVLRRWYWYLPKARRRLRAGDRSGYEAYMAAALPRNSSVVFQSAVGILVTVIVLASL